MSNWITAYFEQSGVPKTGLTPTITVYDLSDDSVDVSAAAMSEIANGLYKFDWVDATQAADYDATKDYIGFADAASADVDDRYVAIDFRASIWNDILEGTLTAREFQRIMLSVLAGKTLGGGTTNLRFRDVADTKDRLNETIDRKGNRSNIVLIGS